MTANNAERARIGLCESQPATAEGVRLHLQQSEDLDCRWAVPHLGIGLQLARQQPVDLLIFDKAYGQPAICDAIANLHSFAPHVPALVWGSSISEPEALRFVQAGASGLLRKTAPLAAFMECIRSLLAGQPWLGDILRPGEPSRDGPSGLTGREQQVLELVQQGLRNREIAEKLGIRPGTVKIHLKHIFEKKGVHGRHGLALAELQEKGGGSWPLSSFLPSVADQAARPQPQGQSSQY